MLHNGQKIKSGHSYQFDLRFDKEILCWFMQRIASKNPTPEGPALETPGRGYNALTPEGPRLSCP